MSLPTIVPLWTVWRVLIPHSTTLVIDLIMPRRDGSGVLGGLELLEEIRSKYPDFQVLVMSDHPNQEAEQSVRNFGVPSPFPQAEEDRGV